MTSTAQQPAAVEDHRDEGLSRRARVLLALLGVGLAIFTATLVLRMPDMAYHAARDAELRATYDTYRSTGVPLVKVNGTGSFYGYVEGEGLTKAAGDDDPGSYLLASWMSHVTGSDSPYTGLRWLLALLTAAPMLLLPTVLARAFGTAVAGLAAVALPGVTWLLNGRTWLLGNEYGKSDAVSGTPVYALYGLPSAVVLLCLVLIAAAVLRRPARGALVAFTVLLVALAAASNLMRSMSGVAVAVALAVVWWVSLRGRTRWLVAPVVGVACAAASLWLPGLVMDRVATAQEKVVAPAVAQLPDAHGLWHPLYLGLSYPQPITGEPSPFGIIWSDEFGWQKAREVDPDVVVASTPYDLIIKDLFLDAVEEKPVAAGRLYLAKAWYTLSHYAGLVTLIAVATLLVVLRGRPRRGTALALALIAVPTLAFGVLPPVLVMPMLYYYTELVAALGYLSALSVGAIAAVAWTAVRGRVVARGAGPTPARRRAVDV